MCVAKAMKCEEKSQKRAAELSGNELEEALSILSESELLKGSRPCIEPSYLASTEDVIERETAKVANASTDVAPLASQIASSDWALTESRSPCSLRRSVHNNWSSSSCLVAPKPGVQSS